MLVQAVIFRVILDIKILPLVEFLIVEKLLCVDTFEIITAASLAS